MGEGDRLTCWPSFCPKSGFGSLNREEVPLNLSCPTQLKKLFKVISLSELSSKSLDKIRNEFVCVCVCVCVCMCVSHLNCSSTIFERLS